MIPVVPPKKDNAETDDLRTQGSKIINAVERKVEEIRQKGLNIGTMALWVGAIAFGSYIIYDSLFGKSKKKIKLNTESKNKPEVKNKKESWVVASIKGYMLAFLLGIAKDKILEALAELEKDENKENI